MPRNQGTSRKGKPKKEMRAAGFGNTLLRSQIRRHQPKSNGSSAHGQGMIATGATTIGVVEQSDAARMKSVLEVDDLSDYLAQAKLANHTFASEREQFLHADEAAREYVPTGQQTTAVIHEEAASGAGVPGDFSFRELSVPRRPTWTPGVTTAAELEARENETFLAWRRGVARREEEIAARASSENRGGIAGASVTPYEKNLHVWRQLWRVLERSAVVLQIVDARNPLFYLSEDLRRYAGELGKPALVLVNKSDYLTARQRAQWSAYFNERGVDHLFFSAAVEQGKIDRAASAAKKGEYVFGERLEEEEPTVVSDDEHASEGEPPNESSAGDIKQQVQRPNTSGDSFGIFNPLTREQLLVALEAFAQNHGCLPDPKYDNRIQFGLVGFPNVGKSSVINVLIGSSKNLHGVVRVGVAAQPGKTKHFQTLLLPDRADMMLCDCPGLVFPSFVSSSADMIAAGVYPIAQMRDHWPVVALVCQRVPRDVLDAHYGIRLPVPPEPERWEGGRTPAPTAEELLGTYCVARSLLAPASGVPDYQRAARAVVRDYAAGTLLYCHAPPATAGGGGAAAADAEDYLSETLTTAIRNTNNAKKLQKLERSLEVAAAAKSRHAVENGDGLDDFDSMLGDLDEEDNPTNGDKRGKSHKSIKKWGKKGRKLRNRDPYGCHSEPDSLLSSTTVGSGGAIVNAGKYSSSYTRANYAGAKAATPFPGRDDRPKKGNAVV